MRYLGIDTSNYTTSAALYDGISGLIQQKRPLPVREGELGLRQSDAVFLHVKQLPEIIEALLPVDEPGLAAVGVSARPRDVEGSYMPCFLAGELAARAAAAALGIPCYAFSHQGGHIAAALLGADALFLMRQTFLVFHVSGGTTECVLARPGSDSVFDIELVSRTLDLAAGQVVDRVGGMLGLPFPAGPALEQLAGQSTGAIRPKATLKNADCCLSGLENICRSLLEKGESRENTARFCQDSVGETILRMARAAATKHPGLPFVFAGGVMSNTGIKRIIRGEFADALFAPAALSADNAAGAAVLACAAHQKAAAPC